MWSFKEKENLSPWPLITFASQQWIRNLNWPSFCITVANWMGRDVDERNSIYCRLLLQSKIVCWASSQRVWWASVTKSRRSYLRGRRNLKVYGTRTRMPLYDGLYNPYQVLACCSNKANEFQHHDDMDTYFKPYIMFRVIRSESYPVANGLK